MMRAGFKAFLRAIIGLAVLAADLAAAPARAEDPPQSCDVPAYLLSSDTALPKVEQALKDGQRLEILVVGSRSSTIGMSDSAAAYPARLQAALREKLPGMTVNVGVELQIKKTADEIAPSLGKLV